MLRVRPIGMAIAVVLSLVALFVGARGYGWLPVRPAGDRTGSVAVVDIEAVAKQLGVDAALEKQIKDAEASLNSQLASLQASLRKQYEDKSKELFAPPNNRVAPSDDPTAAKQQLAEIEKKLNQQLLQAQQTARNRFAVYRASLFQSFRNEVVPVAKKIAKEHGCGVVLTKNETVLLAFDDSHDITSAVAAELHTIRSPTDGQQTSTAARVDQAASHRR